jgi:hypothetical protein
MIQGLQTLKRSETLVEAVVRALSVQRELYVQLLALAQKVSYEIDPDSGFPKFRSGEVIVRMKDGTEFSRRDKISPDEPAPAEGIVKKAMDNMQSVLAPAHAAKIRDMILEIDRADDVATVMQALAGTA